MRLWQRAVVVVVVLGCGSGCATVFKGSHATVRLNSEPEGASVILNGNRIGKTPMLFTTTTKEECFLQFRADGYEPRFTSITHSIGGGWVALDVLLPLYVVNILVDALTGAWFYLDQDAVDVVLEKMSQPSSPTSPSLPPPLTPPPPLQGLPPPSPEPPQTVDPDI